MRSAADHRRCRLGGSLVLAALMTGCIAITPADVASAIAPIDTALTVSAPAIRVRAEAGDAQAQYALSIVFAQGLQGLRVDADLARNWRSRALSTRGFTPITQYIAGYKHHPGRVITTSIPRYDIAPVQSALIENCVALLAGPGRAGVDDALEHGACGGRVNYDRLAGLWSRAAGIHPKATA